MARRGWPPRLSRAHSGHEGLRSYFQSGGTAHGEVDLPEGKRPPSSNALRVLDKRVRPRTAGHRLRNRNAHSSHLREHSWRRVNVGVSPITERSWRRRLRSFAFV